MIECPQGEEDENVAPNMQDRRLKTFMAQEFQTTIVGMLGHDLRQSLQVIQGTYSLLRSRLEEMPQQGWLDRGEQAVTKIEVRSVVGEGSLFSIYAPAAAPSAS